MYNWSKNDTFSSIFQTYVDKCHYLKVNAIVFDGYKSSTKDTTQTSRKGKSSKLIEIRKENNCPFDGAEFFNNYSNKQSFINKLAAILESNGFKVVLCSSDADTTIVKTALEVERGPVTILADDTDILCLLLHHVKINLNPGVNIFLKNMAKKKDTDNRCSYNIRDVISAAEPVHTVYT